MVQPQMQDLRARRDPPAFNVPGVVLALLGVMVLAHVAIALLDPVTRFRMLAVFAFIPARFGEAQGDFVFPGGLAADLWTWLSYSLLHADVVHLVVNAVWLLAFGSPVARRFGPMRFLALSAAASVGGAAAHLLTHWNEVVPVIGASAMVSAYMGAAIRFVFGGLGGIGGFGSNDALVYRAPARPLSDALRNPTMLAFLLVWFGINLVFGIGASAIPGVSGGIAWEAHIGGFLVGLAGFVLFDPVGRGRPRSGGPS